MTLLDKMTDMGYVFFDEKKHNDMFKKEVAGGNNIVLMFNYERKSVLGCVYPTQLIFGDTQVMYINQALVILEKDLTELANGGLIIERKEPSN